jgi:hypothetical protein
VYNRTDALAYDSMTQIQIHDSSVECSFCYFFTAFPMTEISSEHLLCSSCWELEGSRDRGCTFWVLFTQGAYTDSCQTKLVFLCPVDVVLVDVKTELSASSHMAQVNRFAVKKI